MDKKQLSALPRPILTKQQREMPLLALHMSYFVTVSREDIAGKDTLIMNFFRHKEKSLEPEFRTFCQMDDYISQDLTVKNTKWKYGAINSLTGYRYWYKDQGNLVISSAEERKLILDFFKEFRKRNRLSLGTLLRPVIDTDIQINIDNYQDTIKEWRLNEKHQKIKQRIDLDMDKFGPVPKNYNKFIKETVFGEDHYIFYSRKEKRAYCTSCGKEFIVTSNGHLKHKTIPIWNDTDKVKHNKAVTCPYCNKLLTCKSEGMGRQNLYTVRWSVLTQKYVEAVLVRYFCHIKDFRENFKRPQFHTEELYRTVHSSSGAKDYMWGKFKSTCEYRWVEFGTIGGFGWSIPRETVAPRNAVLYRENLEEAIAGTCMKYSAIDLYVDKVNKGNHLQNPWFIDGYFNQYRRRPYLEQLLKIGFYKMTKEILEENEYNLPVFVAGQSVVNSLQIDRIKFKMLARKGDPSIHDLKIMQYAQKISEDDFLTLSKISEDVGYDIHEHYIDLMRYTSLYKINKYLDKAGLLGQKINDYFDYTGWLDKLGYDMRNEFNIYPKDFQRSHDEKSKEYQAYQDKKKREEMRRFNQIIKQMKKENAEIPVFNMSYNDMLLRLPENSTELKREGQVLHHCVGSYIDKVGNGETLIFFIRRKEKPEKPYYTLEWKGKVVQCRGMNNCAMTQEVNEFVDLFSKEMIAYEKKLSKEQIRKDRTWKGKEFTAYEKDQPNGMRRTG